MLNNTIRNSIQTHFFSNTKPKSSEYYGSYAKINDDNTIVKTKVIVPLQNSKVTSLKKLDIVEKTEKIVYSGDKMFDKEELKKENLPENVECCLYCIETNSMYPFLKYLLMMSSDKRLVFPTFTLKDSSIEKLIKYIKSLFDSRAVITYEGKTEINKKTQLWFKYSLQNTTIGFGKSDDKYKWVLPYEIVNLRKMLTFDIDSDVIRLFLHQTDFLFLKDDKGNIYQTPIVGYYGNYYKRTKISAALGHMSESPDSIFGPYYYFNSYGRAMRYACWSVKREPTYIDGELITNNQKGRFKKGGLVRYALFLDNYTSLVSELKETDIKSENKIDITIRKSGDFDGLLDEKEIRTDWMYYYNSIIDCRYREKLTKPYHKSHYSDPIYILKDFEQQTPLEYYYVDTSKVVDNDMDVSNLVIE